jgi:adenine-specific DNA-methyltransferase
MKKPEQMTQEELVAEIKNLRARKKYGLVWEEKSEKVSTLCQTKLPILKEKSSKHILRKGSEKTHYIIEGDNYHTLSVLNYTHKGKIDVIYIDPPYNTGNKDFLYNDHFVDYDDVYRHSKWLNFM